MLALRCGLNGSQAIYTADLECILYIMIYGRYLNTTQSGCHLCNWLYTLRCACFSSLEQWRDISGPQLFSHKRADFMPPLQSVGFSIKCVKWPIPHFHALRVNLNALVDVLQCIMPTITEIFSIGLGLSRASKTQFLVCPRLEPSIIVSPIMCYGRGHAYRKWNISFTGQF